ENLLALESLTDNEFMESNKQELQQQNTAIWKQFQGTIEKRKDEYYVRFPWKNDATTLPDNKAMEVKRLQAIITKFKQDPEMLQEYHETVASQLHQNIIEEVDEFKPSNGSVIHYLPHHTVLTPHKETTKTRIVNDGSAHTKEASSLNEPLHQRRDFLPQICDILLRFHIGDIALTSNVEKAFLQIRLQEQDRDATRFLGMHDISKPFEQQNMVTYRFTRVTFELNCSPFLLAGTIKHHLNNCLHDPKLVEDL
ncbi:hypothetical protein Angca_001236, partial [Angiostrongylus cantonensis]